MWESEGRTTEKMELPWVNSVMKILISKHVIENHMARVINIFSFQ